MKIDENEHHILKIISESNITVLYESVTLLKISVFLNITFLTTETQHYEIFSLIVLT
jgi:hypothetical protein